MTKWWRRLPWTPFAGAAFGAAMALWFYDRTIVAGNPVLWRSTGGDAGSGLAAFRYYINEGWSWPPFEIQSLAGDSSIATTDSNAALALVAKLLHPLGLSAEDWWGAWFIGATALQGAAAVLAVRAFGVRNRVVELAAAVLAVFSPIMLFRAFHPHLMGQFLVLLALAVVGHVVRGEKPLQAAWLGTALVLLGPLVHPYFLPMVAAVVGAAVLAEAVRGRIVLAQFALWAGTTGIALGALLLLTGQVQDNLVPDRQGFAQHSALLLWPIVPQRSGLWPGETWFRHPFSEEGFNYLGAGVAAVFVVGIVVLARRLPLLARRHQLLLVAISALSAYAISPRIVVTRGVVWDLRVRDLAPLLGLLIATAGVVAAMRYRWWPAAVGIVVGVAAAYVANDASTGGDRRIVLAFTLLAAAMAVGLLVGLHQSLDAWRPAAVVVVGGLGAIALALFVRHTALENFTSSMRASGRLMWMAWYSVLISGLVGLARIRRQAVVASIAVVCCVLQIVDTSPLHHWGDEVLPPSAQRVEYLQQLQGLVAGHERVHLVPAFSCTLVDANGFDAFRDTVTVASILQIPVDVVYSARAIDEPCPEQLSIVDEPSVLTVAARPVTRARLGPIPQGFRCNEFGALLLCSGR